MCTFLGHSWFCTNAIELAIACTPTLFPWYHMYTLTRTCVQPQSPLQVHLFAGVYCASASLAVWNANRSTCLFNASFDSPVGVGVAGIGDASAVLMIARNLVGSRYEYLCDSFRCNLCHVLVSSMNIDVGRGPIYFRCQQSLHMPIH